MIDLIRKKLFTFAEAVHLRIFGHDMGNEMRNFLGHLSWSFFGGIIAAGIMLVLNILAGRWLGPVEYGKYSLVIAISSIMIIPMTLGIDTAITYYVAKSSSDAEKKSIVRSSLWVIAISITLVSCLILFFYPDVSESLHVEKSVLVMGIVFSIFLAARNVLDSAIKGFHFFKYQSLIRVTEAVIVLAMFLVFAGQYRLTFESYVFAMLAGYVLMILAVAFRLKDVFAFDTTYTGKVISYGGYAIVGSLFGIMTNSADKILVNKYLGQEQLGLYNAYMTASFLLIGQLSALFINVFFPYLASVTNQGAILKKLNKLALIFSLPALIALGLIVWLVMTLFGEAYTIDWLLIVEFSLLGIMTMYFTALWWLIAASGAKGIRFTSFNGIVSGTIFLLLMFIFGGTLTLYRVVFFLIISLLYAIVRGNFYYGRIE